jgi:multiple sugar transport system permease protein
MPPLELSSTSAQARSLRSLLSAATLTLLASMLLLAFLSPILYSFSASLRGPETLLSSPVVPRTPQTLVLNGETLPLYLVPTPQGERVLALKQAKRKVSTFVDPAAPTKEIVWQGNWRSLKAASKIDLRWGNYAEGVNAIGFWRLFLNSVLVAVIGMVGTVASSTVVAYGFSRFRFPGKGWLFLVLIATIVLPDQVTLVPLYSLYHRLGWIGTWLPLLVPLFFANAYNVFLLRQFFLTIPREMDEAAMMDGAGPLRILWSVILPQARAGLLAVALFHFFYAWNDFFGPLLYLTGKPELQTLSIGLASFKSAHSDGRVELTQAMSVLATLLPLLVFFVSQRVFLRGVVVTAIEK